MRFTVFPAVKSISCKMHEGIIPQQNLCLLKSQKFTLSSITTIFNTAVKLKLKVRGQKTIQVQYNLLKRILHGKCYLSVIGG